MHLFYLVSTILAGITIATTCGAASKCKCFPGDILWPSHSEWNQFNTTIGGRLVAVVPLGSPCHDPNYDADLCTSLQDQWLDSGIQ